MPQLSRVTKCRGCGAEIAFIKTVNGKSIPVDPEAIKFIPEEANDRFVMINGTVERGEPVKRADRIETHIGYRAHFSTCPAADRFRKKNKSERTRENGKPAAG